MPTYDQLEGLPYGDLARSTWAEMESVASDLWSVLRGLDPESRLELERRLRAGTLPPALVASADEEYTEAEGAALELWTRYLPKTSMELGTWALVLLSLLNLMKGSPQPPPPAPPQVQIIVVQLPPEARPLEPAPPLGPPEAERGMEGEK